MDSDRVRSAFKRLKNAYLDCFSTREKRVFYNPPKLHIPLKVREEDGVTLRFVNSMSAVLPSGHSGTKVIWVDEELGETRSRTIVFGPDGKLLRNVDSAQLTYIRCGLMAALASELILGGEHRPRSTGFIGWGKINKATYGVYDALYKMGTPPIIRSESTDDQWKEIRQCQTVISATNNLDKDKLVKIDWFKNAPTKLFIAQDCGFLLGPSFRDFTHCYTDHPEQMDDYTYGCEFPFDGKSPGFRSLLEHDGTDEKKSVYLYGVAASDVITALEGDENGTFD